MYCMFCSIDLIRNGFAQNRCGHIEVLNRTPQRSQNNSRPNNVLPGKNKLRTALIAPSPAPATHTSINIIHGDNHLTPCLRVSLSCSSSFSRMPDSTISVGVIAGVKNGFGHGSRITPKIEDVQRRKRLSAAKGHEPVWRLQCE